MKIKNINFIGTSGWYYNHWKINFYPEELKKNQYLNYYSNNFSTVEINNTFYRLPTQKALTQWEKQVPSGFIFSVKASRYITHVKRLKDADESLNIFLKTLEPLKGKQGPILFQLPPSAKMDSNRLDQFLKILSKEFRYVFEFRNQTWFCNVVYDLLEKYKAALCITDLGGDLTPSIITTDFIYVRLHGPHQAYQGSYSRQKINSWVRKIKSWNQKEKDCFCYFDNDEKAYAVHDALELKNLIEK